VKLGFTAIALAALLSLSSAVFAQQQQSTVPDAPAPQAPRPLSDMNGTITPGKGAGEAVSEPGSSTSTAAQQAAPSTQAPSTQGKDTVQTAPPELPAAGGEPG